MVGQGLKGAAINLIILMLIFFLCRGEVEAVQLGQYKPCDVT